MKNRKDLMYPYYFTKYKGWRIYGAFSQRDIPYKATQLNRSIYSESYKDILTRIDKEVE